MAAGLGEAIEVTRRLSGTFHRHVPLRTDCRLQAAPACRCRAHIKTTQMLVSGSKDEFVVKMACARIFQKPHVQREVKVVNAPVRYKIAVCARRRHVVAVKQGCVRVK
eukprot:2464063-Prymnesium_polylepis.1